MGRETRYELADGVIRAMSPPGGPHGPWSWLTDRAGLYDALYGRRPCRAEAEAGMRIDERTMWQTDLAVTCKRPRREILDPSLIVEVLSPSTRTHDLGRKLESTTRRCRASPRSGWSKCAALDPTLAAVTASWIVQDFVGNSLFESAVLATAIELDVIYADSGL